MLTNIFYYDFYKPYIFKNEKLTSKLPVNYAKNEGQKKNVSSNSKENEYSFFLNKTYKTEIVNYAESISFDLNSIKNAAKNIINNSLSIFNFDALKENFKSELNEFEKNYNSYLDFADKNKNNSPLLSNFADNLQYRVETNLDSLSNFGISFDDELLETDGNNLSFSRLNFDENFFDSLSQEYILKNVGELKNFCKTIYDDTCEIMTVPMEEHMNFKNLNYYYNYIFANENHNTVQIIETGMLVDIVL